jgi:glycosyltransferase involved in cell wall biosynthesis
MRDLIVVMPVYNEEGAIQAVVEKWIGALSSLEIDFEIRAYNDGSKDKTGLILKQMSEKNPQFVAYDKANSGHGPTILTGYRQAAKSAQWIFQMDSDDEMGPESFKALWDAREFHDFLIGRRDGYVQPLPRKIISAISRLTVWTCFGKGVWDVNAPYRLMRASLFAPLFDAIPEDTFAPNLIISGWAALSRLRIFEARVIRQERQTGMVSIKKWRLFKAACRSFWQTFAFRASGQSPVLKLLTTD